jgi:hypothetical protein
MNGLAGDSGMDSALWLVAGAHGETRARLDADASTYALALRSRQVVRLTSTPLVSDAPFFMTGFVGIDVAALPPPFFPCFRGEDGAFAAAMRAAAPWAVTGHLDMALVHAPTPGRGYRALEEAARQTRFAELLALLLAELGLVMGEAGTPAARLRTLGALLAQLAGAARPDFLDVVKGVVVRRVLSMLDHVERVLGSSVCSPHRRRDLETIRDALAGRLERPGLEGPAEFGGTPEGWSAAQRHLARYGHLLTEWPGLLEVAAERGEALFAPA